MSGFKLNPFIVSLVLLQAGIMVLYGLLTEHANVGNGQKLDEAR